MKRAIDPQITLEELQHLVQYNPETGIFSKAAGYSTRWSSGYVYKKANPGEYLKIKINGRQIKAHRIAWFLVYGVWPSCDIDHINGDIHDNRIANLRDVTPSENPINRGDNKNNTSGVKGVHLEHRKGRPPLWRAFISISNKRIYLGRSKSFAVAVAKRKVAEKKYFGEFARAA